MHFNKPLTIWYVISLSMFLLISWFLTNSIKLQLRQTVLQFQTEWKDQSTCPDCLVKNVSATAEMSHLYPLWDPGPHPERLSQPLLPKLWPALPRLPTLWTASTVEPTLPALWHGRTSSWCEFTHQPSGPRSAYIVIVSPLPLLDENLKRLSAVVAILVWCVRVIH